MRLAPFIAGFGVALVLVAAGVMVVGPPSPVEPVRIVSVEDSVAPEVDEAGLDALRALIYAQDIQGVEAVFQSVTADSRAARARQRHLFGRFSELHPLVDRFTQNWLAARPESAAAMTARAMQLYALGWTRRGEGLLRDISMPARQAFTEAHSEGLALAMAAVAVEPALVGASDAILKMSFTTGNRALVMPEVARIMAVAPSRSTLITASEAFATKWGGEAADIAKMCSSFAGLVVDQAGYNAKICGIDGVMAGGALPGPERDTALKMLAANDSPLLDIWRRDAPIVAGDTPTERLAALDAVKETRPLRFPEAQIYDQDANFVAALSGVQRPLEFPDAIKRWVMESRLWAERDPGALTTIVKYQEAMSQDRLANGTVFDRDNMERLYIEHLKIARYSPDAWRWLGTLYARLDPKGLDGLERAQPYLINAMAYSNHSKSTLALAASMKISQMMDVLMSGAPHPDTPRFQRVVQCPMVRELRLLLARCEADGEPFNACSGLPYEAGNMQDLIRDFTAAGVCSQEATAPLESLYYAPQEGVLQAG